MLKVSREATKLKSYLENLPSRLTEEEKELLDIKYWFFRKLVAHEFKWGISQNHSEVLRKCIEVDDLYFGRK